MIEIERVQRERRQPRGTLTFVGDGPLRAQLERRANVRIVGRVAHHEVPRYLGEADVVCAPSLTVNTPP